MKFNSKTLDPHADFQRIVRAMKSLTIKVNGFPIDDEFRSEDVG